MRRRDFLPALAAPAALPTDVVFQKDPERYWLQLRKEQFFLPETRAFMNNGSLGVVPRPVMKAVQDYMENAAALSALTTLTTLTRLLPERDPHPNLYEITLFVLGFLDDVSVWPALLVRWELALLDELGFGLDLSQCASTGANDQLIYVSPKSGRAVSASAGEPYRDRMLSLPQFLTKHRRGSVTTQDVVEGLALTGHFLETRVLLPRGQTLPEARARIIGQITK